MPHRQREVHHRREIEYLATSETIARANREQWNQDPRGPCQHGGNSSSPQVRSSDHIAAIGTDHLANHELRIVTRQEQRRRRDVARLAEAPNRRDRLYLLAHLP